ncbi:putative G-protein coupled receptor 83 [Acipenser oxyrinchus oxyrinchus]|uniref:G-protein coupled receptor 83 n=1 Tax=Acipenser oxyrinchus oxyrinchus TaxID=40147 RepID=A0AAD8CKT8_ACIOX|nr:putative G-protein coupled receptor 83 [Acipenser oxyrinchus oxyrinchus]
MDLPVPFSNKYFKLRFPNRTYLETVRQDFNTSFGTLSLQDVGDMIALLHADNYTQKTLLIVAYLLIMTISLFGNLLVCLVVVQKKIKRAATNVFIFNLALAHLMLTLLNTPFKLACFVSSTWDFGKAMCHMSRFTHYCSLHVSTFTLTAISLEIYQAIMHPRKPRMTAARGIAYISFIWIMASCFSLPHTIYQKLMHFDLGQDNTRQLCLPDFPAPSDLYCKYLDLVTFIILCVVPLLVITITYTIVSKRQRNVIRDINSSQWRHNQKIIKMLMLVVLVFAVCWFPLNFFVVLSSSKVISINNTLYFAFHWLAMSSTCYNPFIYYWLNVKFHTGVKSLLRICVWERVLSRVAIPTVSLEAERRIACPEAGGKRKSDEDLHKRHPSTFRRMSEVQVSIEMHMFNNVREGESCEGVSHVR